MPDVLYAKKHTHTLHASQKLPRETLDIPLGDTGNILMEDGDDLLSEDSEYLVHDGSVETMLAYKLSAKKHTYILHALLQTPDEAFDSFAVTIRPPASVGYTVTTFAPPAFGWAFAMTVPVKALTLATFAPTIIKTTDQLVTEASDNLVQEDGDDLLVDI